MLHVVTSRHGVPIRLPDERWTHITEEHCELAGMREEVLATVSDPLRIVAGKQGEVIAIRELEDGKYLVVPYRQLAEDGFIITAFLTSRAGSFDRRKQVWPV